MEFENSKEPSFGGGGGGGWDQGKKCHSIKVPRLYKDAAKALAKVEQGQEGVKGAIHSLRHPNIKAITALVTEAIKHSPLLAKLISKSKILETEKGLSNQVPLTKILITELLWGKKRLGGESKPVLAVISYRDKFDKVINKMERKDRCKRKGREEEPTMEEEGVEEDQASFLIKKPRYVRVNTLKTDLSTVIDYLASEGWNQVETQDYYSMSGYSFTLDNFVENLLVFPPGTELHKHPLYFDGSLVLQDKASCLPPLALKPRLGRGILDACAAPGMKTSLLAAMTNNECPIVAVEKDTKRCDTLRTMLDGLGATNVTVINQDFTDINPHDYPQIEYILVDPSCSGSGMYNRVEIQLEQGNKDKRSRLKALSYCQRKLLVHAMKFPSVKRIVYSTCSVNSIENEDVIAAALEWGEGYTKDGEPHDTSHQNFRVKQTLQNWPHRLQNPNYEWSEMCVKADYDNDLTDGFFVTVLERMKSQR